MNKKCPRYHECKEQFDKMDEVWRGDCPPGSFKDCLKYDMEEYDALRIDNRPPGEHKEDV